MTVPDETTAFAAGIYTGSPEASWEDIAAVIEALGLGRYKPDALVSATKVWASHHGGSLSRMVQLLRSRLAG